jgi:hypothetical protein
MLPDKSHVRSRDNTAIADMLQNMQPPIQPADTSTVLRTAAVCVAVQRGSMMADGDRC